MRRGGGWSCASDLVEAKRSSLSVPGSPLETRATDLSRSCISLEWNEMLVVVVVVLAHTYNVRRRGTRLMRPRSDRARANLQSTTYRQTAASQFTYML